MVDRRKHGLDSPPTFGVVGAPIPRDMFDHLAHLDTDGSDKAPDLVKEYNALSMNREAAKRVLGSLNTATSEASPHPVSPIDGGHLRRRDNRIHSSEVEEQV